jgi:hypothetical protein
MVVRDNLTIVLEVDLLTAAGIVVKVLLGLNGQGHAAHVAAGVLRVPVIWAG